MTTAIDRVRAETARFRARLPELLQNIPGRWVIFRDGEVVADFLTEKEAHDEAVARYGTGDGFLVVQIEEEQPRTVSPLFIYKLA